jgi:23S rRNA pseudouridine2605 synthase
VFKKVLKWDGKLIEVEEISYITGESKNKVGIKIKIRETLYFAPSSKNLKYDIIKIDCVGIGHLTKKDLPRGHWKHLTKQEVNTLKML